MFVLLLVASCLFCSLPCPQLPLVRIRKVFYVPLVSTVTVPRWLPLTGLSWICIALCFGSWLQEIFRHLIPPTLIFIDEFKTESTRKLSNFNSQWKQTLYQNNFKNIAFFFTFFKA